jgi:hypothetical protein
MSATNFLKRDLPMLIIIVTAIPMILYRFIDHPTIKFIVTETGFWSSIISMLGWGLGVIYLFQGEYHALKQKPDLTQKFSFATLCGFSLLLVVLFFALPGGTSNDWYQFVYLGFYRAQSTAFYGLMFLYLMSASYRMLRVKSIESTVLLVSGFLYLMRSTSIFTYYAPWLVPLGEWIFDYPNKAAVTAAVMAAAFGSILIGIRTMLGRERTAVEVS